MRLLFACMGRDCRPLSAMMAANGGGEDADCIDG